MVIFTFQRLLAVYIIAIDKKAKLGTSKIIPKPINYIGSMCVK
jgi:hypothetical protein